MVVFISPPFPATHVRPWMLRPCYRSLSLKRFSGHDFATPVGPGSSSSRESATSQSRTCSRRRLVRRARQRWIAKRDSSLMSGLTFCDVQSVGLVLRTSRAVRTMLAGADGSVKRVFDLLDPSQDIARTKAPLNSRTPRQGPQCVVSDPTSPRPQSTNARLTTSAHRSRHQIRRTARVGHRLAIESVPTVLPRIATQAPGHPGRGSAMQTLTGVRVSGPVCTSARSGAASPPEAAATRPAAETAPHG